jgi:hypothetical protein
VSVATCPKGHQSATDDFCDTCGAKIGGTMAIPQPSPAVPPAAQSPGTPCPHCGTPSGAGRFCENCGYDTSTGKVPTLSPAPAATTGQWTATVTADRAWFDANAIEGVTFPAAVTTRTVALPPPQIRIGRRSRSKGTDPELDLSAEPLDPGVSHSHALLTLNIDGVWLVSDLGSTNGTYVNDENRPLTAGQSRTLGDGDRVHVGAWTTITLHAPS